MAKKVDFTKNWTTDNNGVPLNDEEVERYIAVKPSVNQVRLSEKPFYLFMHFGMNTATGREWGSGLEKTKDFTIKKIKADQWVKCAQSAGATGIVLTCKHHDGFCLWPSKYTDFTVENTDFKGDIVKMVSDACHDAGLDFGIYLSPWDMHEKSYGTKAYDDFYCNQLEELLTGYGKISEVWLDGAKGANARYFEYDWNRYYALVRDYQPTANIAICGPDIRWVGNEKGIGRKNEYSVVPKELQSCEAIQEKSQRHELSPVDIVGFDSKDEDLGSRKVLKAVKDLAWYPAEVDVSIRNGWFWKKSENSTVKSVKKLREIYINSVGNNSTLILNVPPNDKGVIGSKEAKRLKELGAAIREITAKPIIAERLGAFRETDGFIDFKFDSEKTLKYIILKENIRYSQRVEAFDIYVGTEDGKYKLVHSGTIIGSQKIVEIKPRKCTSARLVIRQSRSNPVIKEIGFYE